MKKMYPHSNLGSYLHKAKKPRKAAAAPSKTKAGKIAKSMKVTLKPKRGY